MAMLPVGMSVGYGEAYTADPDTNSDTSSTNADTDQSVRREGETSTDSESQKSWTRTHTNNSRPTFKDALRKTQLIKKSDTAAPNSSAAALQAAAKQPVALPIPVPVTAQPPQPVQTLTPAQLVAQQAENVLLATESKLTPITAPLTTNSAVSTTADLSVSTTSEEAAKATPEGDQAASASSPFSLLSAVDTKEQMTLLSFQSGAGSSGGESSKSGAGKEGSSGDPSGEVVDVQSSTTPPVGMTTILQPALSSLPQDAAVIQSSAAERVAVAQQVGNHMAAMTQQANIASAGGQHTVTINVNPDHWGDMKITLTMDGSAAGAGPKSITATIIAGSNAVRDALTGQTSDLKDSLQTAGIKLDKLEITVANQLSTTNPTHSASEMGFNSNSQNSNGNNNGQSPSQGQAHNGSFSADTSGQQQRSGQQFASLFGDANGFAQPQSWQPANTFSTAINTEANAVTPISLVEATSSHGVNVLA